MFKSEKPDTFIRIARYFNEHPRVSVKTLLKFCQKQDILRSYDSVYRALRLMEENRILLNGSILVKNHGSYKNIHYLIQIEGADEFKRFIHNKNSIEVVYRSRQGEENILYMKTTKVIDFSDFNCIESLEWKSYNVIFPWKWDNTEEFLYEIPDITPDESLPPDENLKANPDFEITRDMEKLLYWYKINLRLPDVPIMKETRFDHRKVKTIRNMLLADSIVHFPIFLHGARHYVCLYFSFFTKYYEVFLDLFARNSGTSYLITSESGRVFLFVNTTRPGWVLHAMESFENTGIISKMFFCYLQTRWDPIMEEYRSGQIPEKYFWMFGKPKKKK